MTEYKNIEIDELRNNPERYIDKGISIEGRLVEIANGNGLVSCESYNYDILGLLQVIDACGVGEEAFLRFTYGTEGNSNSLTQLIWDSFDTKVKLHGKLEKFNPVGLYINEKEDYATIHSGSESYHLRLDKFENLE